MNYFGKKVVEEIREIAGSCNQSVLTRIAVDDFIKKHSTNGKPNVKDIAEIVKQRKEAINIETMRLKVEEYDKNQKKK